MKTKSLTIISSQLSPEIEEIILKTDSGLKELARKNARHFAKLNLPAPLGDYLVSYTGEIKTGYEQLAARIFQMLQPQTHFPEASMDNDLFKEKDKHLDAEIKSREDENHHNQYELGNYNPGSIPLRLWITGVTTAIIFLGEIIFNAKSFQITGENLLFALIISFSISLAIAIFSHIASFMYKGARTKVERWLVVGGSLLLVSAVFTVLAVFRSDYLSHHDVNVSPANFVLFNLFFFIVSALLSFFLLPTWHEIKENLRHVRLHYVMKKRNRHIKKLKDERIAIKDLHTANNKQRMRLIHHANYAAERIRKMYFDCVEVFKGTNLIFRTDKQTPNCFSAPVPEPDVEDIAFTIISQNTNRK
ncbi:MAG TPA: hypothetical protein VI757_12795 [Bacteroidia bacterium]|nr:hypothetical protein [Bacteroidia bacterium]